MRDQNCALKQPMYYRGRRATSLFVMNKRRKHFGELALEGIMAEGAAWSEDRAIEEALTI